MTPPYQPRRESRGESVPLRGLHHHLRHWGDAPLESRDKPLLVMLHGWMDTGASFQFAVDALAELEGDTRHVAAPDWRGFGLTDGPPGTDSYAFADYLADLDGLLDRLSPGRPVDLLGHSMGGNIAMVYAGVRPGRVRRLVNLEGFGLPASDPAQAPARQAQWLDELKTPAQLLPYPDLQAVAKRLRKNNPLLPADRALWLAGKWAAPGEDGLWRLRADPVHKRVGPLLYRVDEVLACWRRIEAPLLWVEGDRSGLEAWWGGRYTLAEFHERLREVPRRETAVLSPAGHMLHHDQPDALAARLKTFLDAPG
jgi:pimeloyl-ACP methyl ester carboxylesterase